MATAKSIVTKRVKTPQSLRYCPVVLSANGRIKPDVVLVNGKEERHPEGAYYMEWREGKTSPPLGGKDAATPRPPPAKRGRTKRHEQWRHGRA